ncbi:hypothetical protein F2Q70_00015676 [Brassica cretica]|uniref:Uncharacterized protein n=1 Tax=Brassica cretica TaxID=69181 RepID=A0A8S9I013_BRACR|nr:hypothetical protein F2Q70_00015676 [Brassica cretica]
MFCFFPTGSLASHYLDSCYVLVLKIDFGRCEAIYSLYFTQRYNRVLIFLLLLPCRFMSLDSTSPVPINSYGTTCSVAPGLEAWFYSACTIYYGKFLVRAIFFKSHLEFRNHVA